MIIDVHCHYTLSATRRDDLERFSFEPLANRASTADTPPPTAYDTCVSPRALRRGTWRVARWLLNLHEQGTALDRVLAEHYARHLFAPGPIDRYVLLAFDAVHDDDGRIVPLPRPGDRFGSDIYTSNTFIRSMCREYPQRFLFGASVHPYRSDAEDCIEEVFAAGACLLKWLPVHHNIDITDERSVRVLRCCARLGLPVLVHYADEFTLAMQRPAYRALGPLLETLRALRRQEEMPTTIVAHVATPVTPWGSQRPYRDLLAALTGEFADAPLYADISALCSWAKAGYFRKLARRPALHHKLLFGSDFPVPPALVRLGGAIRGSSDQLRATASWPQQAAWAGRLAGYQDIVFQRAAELLPHVGSFTPQPAT